MTNTPATVGNDLVRKLRERSVFMRKAGHNDDADMDLEAASQLAAVTAERDALIDANNAAEIDAGLTSNGNLWRFWSVKAQTMATRATTAEAQLKTAREALEPFAELPLAEKHRHFAQILVCPDGDDAAGNWAPKILAARAALNPKAPS